MPLDIRAIAQQAKALSPLYVEDEAALGQETELFLKRFFGRVDRAMHGIEGLALFEQWPYEIVCTDLKMPKMGGIAMLEQMLAKRHDFAIVVMTATEGSEGLEGLHAKFPTMHYTQLRKPVDYNAMINAIAAVVAQVTASGGVPNRTA